MTAERLAWVLLAAAGCGAAFSSAGLVAGWISAGLVVWLAVALYPTDLIRPRGLGAWILWAGWGCLSAFLCPEPLVAAAPAWSRATGVLIFALAYSWWGRPHRRVWLAGIWTGAAVLGVRAGLKGYWDPAAAGFVAAAAGSLLIARIDEMPERSWRAALWSLRLLVPVMILAGMRADALPGRDKVLAWRQAAALAAAAPSAGAGPGRFFSAFVADGFSGAPERETAGSEWLETAAETGVPGLALLLIATLTGLLPPAYGSRPRAWERRAASGAAWGLAAVSLFQGLFRNPELNLLWFTALACGAPGSEEEETRPFRIPAAAAWTGVAVCLLAPALRWVAAAGLRPAAADNLLELAAAVAPGDPDLRWEQARRELAARPVQWGRALARLEQARAAAPNRAAYLREEARVFRAVGAGPRARGRPAAASRSHD